ncbi:MAG: Gfo/Idh/MocA family protein [Vulcanimicrobiaceae bacterium]
MRVGIWGGGFGTRVHLPGFRAQGNFEVVALGSPERGPALAREHGVAQGFQSLAAMLAECELDLLAVASPPFDHRDAVLAALARGLHVVCEKPLARTVAEAEAICEAAARAGTVCALNHEFRYLPALQALRELVAADHLGPLRAIEYIYASDKLRGEVARPRGWFFERARGGGISQANLSHQIDAASWLAGRAPLHATGYERTANLRRHDARGEFAGDAADGSFALIEYGEGLVATCCADGTRAVPSVLVAVHGETRTAVSSGSAIVETATFTVDREETAELGLAPLAHAGLRAVDPYVPLFVSLLDDVVAAIERRAAPNLPTFAQGLATQRVLEAVGYGR